jgi:two-component system OmpR family sensor kinase
VKSAQSLARDLTRSLLWLIATVWIATSIGAAWYLKNEVQEGFDAALIETSHRLLDLVVREKLTTPATTATVPSVARSILTKTASDDDYLMYQVVNASNELLLRSANAPEHSLQVPLETGFSTTDAWRLYTLQQSGSGIFIHVGDPVEHRTHALLEGVPWLLVPMLAILPFLGFFIRAVIRRKLAPVGELAAQIQMRGGEWLEPVTCDALPSELRVMTDSTNHLLQRLSDALDTERSLAANAAHELRTPLTTTRLRLQTALDEYDPRAVRENVSKALDSLDQLSRRAEKLLQMSRAESGSALTREPVNLGALSSAVAQEFWSDTRFADRVDLDLPEDRDVLALGDFDSLAIALRNLVENALRYGGPGKVEISVQSPATIRVRDEGPGVPAGRLEELRQRHSKGSRLSPGYGLGLSIVSVIAQRQKGELALCSPVPGQASGFEACLVLRPVASA